MRKGKCLAALLAKCRKAHGVKGPARVLERDGVKEGAKTHILERPFLDLAEGRLNNGKA
jgi:hypothetical protein